MFIVTAKNNIYKNSDIFKQSSYTKKNVLFTKNPSFYVDE